MRSHFAAIPVHGGAEAEHALNAFLGSAPGAPHRAAPDRRWRAERLDDLWQLHRYRLACAARAWRKPRRPGRKDRIDDREILDEAAFARFARLRAWRELAADRDGRPAVRRVHQRAARRDRPASGADARWTRRDRGVGDARVDKYGAAVLEILQTEARALAAPPVADPET